MKLVKTIYIFLLLYMIASLTFWGLSLQKQNKIIYEYELISLEEHKGNLINENAYNKKKQAIDSKFTSRNMQFLGEGIFFIIVILIAAITVYTALKNNIQLSNRQSNFMLSITHELKSPIAAVKLNLETIRRRKLEEDTQKMLVDRCINETDRLNDLCNNLLLASQMESKHFTSTEEIIALKPIIEDSARMFQNRSKHQIDCELEDIEINADPFLIKLAINNLLENAIKYSLPGTKVTLALHEYEDSIIFSVADEGGGVPNNEKEKIFKKFYRMGNENARKTKGTGLGLFLTAQIVKLNKGTISVRDNEPLGSIFEINFPKTNKLA